MTLAASGTEVSSGRCDTFNRALPMAVLRCSSVISVQSSFTEVTPGREPTRARTSCWIWARSGQPAVVSAMVTTTAPSAPTRAARAMPRSTMSLPSSGSITPRSTASTSSLVGRAVASTREILPARAGETRSDGRLRIVTEGTSEGSTEPRLAEPRLAVLKALGDNTRYAIYLELARSPRPLATAEIAESLDLHPNTVRPHLERMRDVGLLAVEADARGAVGRPQHRYSVASDAPVARARAGHVPGARPHAAAGGRGRRPGARRGDRGRPRAGGHRRRGPGPGPRPPRRRRPRTPARAWGA